LKPDKKNILSVIALLVAAFLFCNSVDADEPYRVLILPFTIHSEKDLSFLQKGIGDMLSTRLTVEGKVIPIGKAETEQALEKLTGPIDKQAALMLGNQLSADYVLFGSLTVLGDSISTDARFIDVHNKKQAVVFNEFGKSQGDVIYHINLFAGQINEKVFGQRTDTYRPPKPQTAAPDVHRHPDKLLSGETSIRPDVSGSPAPGAATTFSAWRSRKFKTVIKSIAIGDVNGDNKNEIVFIGDNEININKYTDKLFERVALIKHKGFNNFLGVDIADVNRNGKAEIFVTNLPKNYSRLKSFVLEWNGSKFKKVSDNNNWYYRTINIPGRGIVLIGQERGIGQLFKGKVYEMIWNNGRYEPGDQLILPSGMSVYGFAYGDALNSGQEMIVAFSKSEKIHILDQSGNNEWSSSENYGGSAVYLESLSYLEAFSEDRKEDEKRVYLPQRIHVADLDKDGKNEIIVVKNEDKAGSFPRLRYFENGYIECLSWNVIGMNFKWKTQKISGYISDYVIGDLNNDGNNEVIFSVVAKKSSITGTKKSYIVSWNVNK